MSVAASQTVAGEVYRETRPERGVYYMRPKGSKRNTPKALVLRLTNSGKPLAGYWSGFLKDHPTAVLMIRYMRGLSTLTGEKWETKDYVLLSADRKMRAVQTKPGYGR